MRMVLPASAERSDSLGRDLGSRVRGSLVGCTTPLRAWYKLSGTDLRVSRYQALGTGREHLSVSAYANAMRFAVLT
eukprot:2266677-Rhodomonas_salina.8